MNTPKMYLCLLLKIQKAILASSAPHAPSADLVFFLASKSKYQKHVHKQQKDTRNVSSEGAT